MHYLINLIVEGENEAEAIENAETFASDLVEQGEFDWYDFNGRWGKSEAFDIKSERGAELLEEGMKSSRSEFDRAMATIRYMMANFTDDQIYNGEFEYKAPETDGLYLSRYMFSVADGRGNSTYVYSQGWGKVENDKELASATKGDDKLWVVAVDFHN